jgi:hypothetical protein
MFEIRTREGVIEGSQQGLYFVWEATPIPALRPRPFTDGHLGGTYIDVYNGDLDSHAEHPFDTINTSRRGPGDGRILFCEGNFRRKVNEWIEEFNREVNEWIEEPNREFGRDAQ